MDRRGPVHPVSLTEVCRSSTTFRVKCLKLGDALLGRALAAGVKLSPRTPTPMVNGRVRRILIIRPGGIGDAVLAMPFIRQTKRAFPQASIDLLAEGRNAAVFSALHGAVDHCDAYDRRPWRFWRSAGRAPYDLVFDTEQYHHASALMAWATRAPVRVGFDTNPRRNRCYTILVPYRHEEFEGMSFLRMLSAVTGQVAAVNWDRPFLDPRAEDLEWAKERLSPRSAVALALRGGIRERCWEPQKVRELLLRLLTRDLDICLLGGRADRGLAKDLSRVLPRERMRNVVGQASLLQSAAVLSRCRVFVGTDSGLMHLASGVGTPVVALFGAGIEAKWAPPGSRHRILNRHLPCSPCTRFGYTPRCPIGVQCLRDLSVDEVWAAVCELL